MNNLLNQSMMLLGIPGSGKSFFAKLLIIAIALSTDDDIIILDPEGEYTPLVKALGGSVIRYAVGGSDWVNAMDMENGYGEGSPVAFKSQFIIHQVDVVGHQIVQGVHHFAHTKEEQQIPNLAPQSPTNNQVQPAAPNTQQPHQLHSDGAVPHDRVPNSTPAAKQKVAQYARQSAPSVSQKHNLAPQQKSTGTMKSGKDSIKTSGIRLPERTIKAGKATVKTLDQFEGAGVKTVQGTMSIPQKVNAVARTRQHIPPAATIAKNTADYTAS